MAIISKLLFLAPKRACYRNNKSITNADRPCQYARARVVQPRFVWTTILRSSILPAILTFGHWGEHKQMGARRSVSMAHHGHIVRVATEFANILLYPVECGHLVHEAVVASNRPVHGGGQEACACEMGKEGGKDEKEDSESIKHDQPGYQLWMVNLGSGTIKKTSPSVVGWLVGLVPWLALVCHKQLTLLATTTDNSSPLPLPSHWQCPWI